MSTKNILILVIIGIAVLAGIYFLSPKTDTSLPEIKEEAGFKTYSSVEYDLSFRYPTDYLLVEREVGTIELPQKSIILVEDTEQNRAILEGRTAEVGEGPTAITIDIFQNTENMSPENLVSEKTNWIMRDKPQEAISIGGRDGFTYFWDGLYAGKSSVVTSNTHAYIFSVTWITAEDQMIKDFNKILSSVKFSR